MASTVIVKEETPRPGYRASARTNLWRKRKEAELAVRQPEEVKPLDYTALRRASRLGFVIGAVLGVVVVMGLLGPWAASLAQ